MRPRKNKLQMILDGRLDSRRPRKWIFPRGRTPSSLSLSLSSSGGRMGDRWRGMRAPSLQRRSFPLEDSISVSLILQCSRARTKGTRAENTNYNDTRPPPRKQTRCPCINLSVFSEGTSGQDESRGYFLRNLFFDGLSGEWERRNLVIRFRRCVEEFFFRLH